MCKRPHVWALKGLATHRVWCEQEAAHTDCVWTDIRIAHTCGRGYFVPHAQQILLIFTPCLWHEVNMLTRPSAATLDTCGVTDLVAIRDGKCSCKSMATLSVLVNYSCHV